MMAQKYTTGNPAAQRKMGVTSAEDRGIDHTEPRDDRDSLTIPMQSGTGGQKTDPSVRLGGLTGPAAHGEVDMATTMRKPQAYRK
jgi:hypothetical protein